MVDIWDVLGDWEVDHVKFLFSRLQERSLKMDSRNGSPLSNLYILFKT